MTDLKEKRPRGGNKVGKENPSIQRRIFLNQLRIWAETEFPDPATNLTSHGVECVARAEERFAGNAEWERMHPTEKKGKLLSRRRQLGVIFTRRRERKTASGLRRKVQKQKKYWDKKRAREGLLIFVQI